MDPSRAEYPERLIEAIHDATVLSIFFVRIGQSFIVDLRNDADSDPIAIVDEMAISPYDRLLSIQKLRPTLPLPDEMTVAPWADRVGSFAATGVLDAVVERCRECGGRELSGSAISCYRKLETLEGAVMRDIVRGVGMQTIWKRDESSGSSPSNT